MNCRHENILRCEGGYNDDWLANKSIGWLNITGAFSTVRFQILRDVLKLNAKFKSSFQNSQAGLQTKHLIGFVEFRDQSQPLFTNRLVNSETNFRTSQRISELRNEVRNITVKGYLKSTVKLLIFEISVSFCHLIMIFSAQITLKM